MSDYELRITLVNTERGEAIGIEEILDEETGLAADPNFMDDAGLATTSLMLDDMGSRLRKAAGQIKLALKHRLEDRGATVYQSRFARVTLENETGYDKTKLGPILDSKYVTIEELQKAGAYTPEHTATTVVPENWNMTSLRPFAKRDAKIKDTIEAAKMVTGQKVIIKPVEQTEEA